ncbi:MAG: Hsp20/alpha crystallin family protein [Gaiellaceae bacterium]
MSRLLNAFEGNSMTTQSWVPAVDVWDDRFYRFECRFGTFTRSVGLPQGVDESQIHADFEDGVLEIHVAKPEEVKPRRIEIGGESQPTIEGSATQSS